MIFFVHSYADIQNLVTGVILRQTNPFTEADIQQKIRELIQDAAPEAEDLAANICKRIWARMGSLGLIRKVKGDNDRYYLSINWPAVFL